MVISLWILFINFYLWIGQINEFSMQKLVKISELKGLSSEITFFLFIHILFNNDENNMVQDHIKPFKSIIWQNDVLY